MPTFSITANVDPSWDFKTELNKLAAAICPDCKGTGRIALLNSVAECHCRQQPASAEVSRASIDQIDADKLLWRAENSYQGMILLPAPPNGRLPSAAEHLDQILAAVRGLTEELRRRQLALSDWKSLTP